MATEWTCHMLVSTVAQNRVPSGRAFWSQPMLLAFLQELPWKGDKGIHGSQETENSLVIRVGKILGRETRYFCLQICLHSKITVVKAFNLLHQGKMFLLLQQCELSPVLNPTFTVLIITNSFIFTGIRLIFWKEQFFCHRHAASYT